MLSRSQRPRAPERARCRARYRPAAPQPQSSPRRCRRHTQLCRWCALRHEGHVATLEVCIRRLRGHWSSPSPRVHSPVSRGSLQWFWAVLQGIVRMYGFEGEAGREGERFTRTIKSSYGRFGNSALDFAPVSWKLAGWLRDPQFPTLRAAGARKFRLTPRDHSHTCGLMRIYRVGFSESLRSPRPQLGQAAARATTRRGHSCSPRALTPPPRPPSSRR